MITLPEKSDCCGCSACAQRCPRHCIEMQEDAEGFLYPAVDTARCVECGVCERVCPMLNPEAPQSPRAVYAAKNPDEEIRMKSSSGGLFTLLAEQTLARGGVVFGARFNAAWEVEHAYTEQREDLQAFRGSKYVQSRIGNSYAEAERFLKAGREVLFSGTPCQIAGLKRFLGKEYSHLLTLDIVCHGVPSPLVWRNYLRHVAKGEEISAIQMRDKKTGWNNYRIVISSPNGTLVEEPGRKNLFMEGFLKDLYLRPSCHNCPAKAGRSRSDITLGDYWGGEIVHPELTDNQGIGLVLVHNQQGDNFLVTCGASKIASHYEEAVRYNPCILRSVAVPRARAEFWARFSDEGISALEKVCRKLRPHLFSRLLLRVKQIMWRIIHFK